MGSNQRLNVPDRRWSPSSALWLARSISFNRASRAGFAYLRSNHVLKFCTQPLPPATSERGDGHWPPAINSSPSADLPPFSQLLATCFGPLLSSERAGF